MKKPTTENIELVITGEEFAYVRNRMRLTMAELSDHSSRSSHVPERTRGWFYHLEQCQDNIPVRWLLFLRELCTPMIFDALVKECRQERGSSKRRQIARTGNGSPDTTDTIPNPTGDTNVSPHG